MIEPTTLKNGEHYWVDCTGVDPDDPIQVGIFWGGLGDGYWEIRGQRYTPGLGITPLKSIPRYKKVKYLFEFE